MNWKTAILPALLAVGLTGCTTEQQADEPVRVSVGTESCVRAMDAAEELVTGPVVEQTEESVVLIGLIPAAFEAGVNMDDAAAQSIIDTLDETAARSEARNIEIESLVAEYNEAAEECRAATGRKA